MLFLISSCSEKAMVDYTGAIPLCGKGSNSLQV